MNRLVLGAVLGLTVAACAADETSQVSSDVTVSRRYLLVYRSEGMPRDAATKIAKAGGKLLRSLPDAGIALIGGTDAVANKLASDPAVLAIGPEHFFELHADDPTPQPASDMFTPLQWDMRRIGAPALWSRTIPSSTVAVIDTGVMSDHVELDGVVTYGKTTSYCAGDLPGKAGYPTYGGIADETNWTDAGPTCWPFGEQLVIDPAFHGTHVAGTIAAPANGFGTIGVSPTTKIAAYKVFDIGFNGADFHLVAYDFPLYVAIEDAVARGYKVVNMSLGGGLDRSTREGNAAFVAWERVAARAYRRGTLVVAAAGNDTTNNNGSLAFIPSDLPSVMSVSATGVSAWDGDPQFSFDDNGLYFDEFNGAPGSDVLAFYSNFGAAVDIAAPGGDFGANPDWFTWNPVLHQILAPCALPRWDQVEPGVWQPVNELDPYVYCWAMGTSMAAPHVAGVAAAVRALHPTFTPGDTRSWLKNTATPMDGRQGFGAGLVNADVATR